MPNIRMLTAQRELTEKERVKNQGTLKAQRSQEMDTQDVAKKTNTSEAARAFKKAQSDLRSAKAEEQLAETKAKYAAIGAAIGAIGTLVSIGAAAVTLGKGSKDEKPGEGPKPKEAAKESTAKPSGSGASSAAAKPPATKPDASKPGAPKPDAVKPDASKPGAPKPDAVKPDASKPGAPKPDAVKPDAVKPDAVKPDAIKPDAIKPDAVKPDAIKPDAIKPDAVKPDAVKPDAVKPDAVKPDAVKPDAIKPDAVKPDASKPEKPEKPEKPDDGQRRNSFGATQAEVAQANQIKQLLEGITDLGGMEKSKLSSIDWNKGGGNDEFKTKDERAGSGSGMETFLTAFKGPKALEELGNRNAMKRSKAEFGGAVDKAKAETNRIDQSNSILKIAENGGNTSGLNQSQIDGLKQTGIIGENGEVDQKKLGQALNELGVTGVTDGDGKFDPSKIKDAGSKISGAREQLASELSVITGNKVSSSTSDLDKEIASAKTTLDNMSNALNGNDPLAFVREADTGARVEGSKDPSYFDKDAKRSPLEAAMNAVGGTSARQEIANAQGNAPVSNSTSYEGKSSSRQVKAQGETTAKEVKTAGIIGQIQSGMRENLNNDSVRAGTKRNGNALFAKIFGNTESKLNDSFRSLDQAKMSKDPVMKALFDNGAVEIGKDGKLKVNSDNFFSSKSDKALSVGVTALQGPSGGGGNQTAQQILETAGPAQKAQVLATLAQNGAAGDVAKILSKMEKGDMAAILSAKGADGKDVINIAQRAEIIGAGVKGGSISPTEAKQMINDLSNPQNKMLDTARAINSDPSDPNKASNLALLNKVTGPDGKIDQTKLQALPQGEKDAIQGMLKDAKNQNLLVAAKTNALDEVANLNGNARLGYLLDSNGALTEAGKKYYNDPTTSAGDKQKLDNLSLLKSVTTDGQFDQTKADKLKGTPDGKALDQMLNIGATNLAFREAVAKDPKLAALADTNGNLKSEYFTQDGNLSENLVVKDVVKDKDGKPILDANGNEQSTEQQIGGSKINDENQLKKVTSGGDTLSDEDSKKILETSRSNMGAETLNQMLDSQNEDTKKVAARIYKDMSQEERAALGPAFDRNKLGGAKEVEKPTGFNAFMMYMNVGMPGIQFMLQQLDKMREAEEQKQEATKKKNAANKLMGEIAKNLKRTQGESGGSGLQGAGAGVGGAK